MSIKKRFNLVNDRLNAALMQSRRKEIDLLAVSKKQSIEKIKQLYELGQRKFGESYIQEALNKMQVLSDLNIQWHFIGPIQSNKTKFIAEYFSWVQSVDTVKLLTRLNHQRSEEQPRLNVLLQLKVGDEDSKRGFNSKELLNICDQLEQFPRLKIRGLMCIPAPVSSYQQQLDQFKLCFDIYQKMQGLINVDTLSIGMSSDMEAAVASGSTMVRIGTDLFGARHD